MKQVPWATHQTSPRNCFSTLQNRLGLRKKIMMVTTGSFWAATLIFNKLFMSSRRNRDDLRKKNGLHLWVQGRNPSLQQFYQTFKIEEI